MVSWASEMPGDASPRRASKRLATAPSANGIGVFGPYPSQELCTSESLWKEKTTLVLVLRRLGCPLVREHARSVVQQVPAFRLRGIRVVAVSGDVLTAGAFIDAVWHFEGRPLPLFHDPELGFYKALGLRPAETWRVLSPKVLFNIFSLNSRAASCDDVMCPNTKFLGGELVFGPSSSSHPASADEPERDTRLFVGLENSYFEHTDPDSLFSEVMKAHSAVGTEAVGLNNALCTISQNVIHGTSSPRPKQRLAHNMSDTPSTAGTSKALLAADLRVSKSDHGLSHAVISCTSEATRYGQPAVSFEIASQFWQV